MGKNKREMDTLGRTWNKCFFSTTYKSKALVRLEAKQLFKKLSQYYKFYGEGNGTPLQYSCLENPMDGRAWWAAVHGVAKSLRRLHFHFSLSCIGEGNGNPLQRSCLENPRNGRDWWAAVYGVTQSRTRLKRLSSSSSIPLCEYSHTWVVSISW